MKHLFSTVLTVFLWFTTLAAAAPLSKQTLLEAASAWLKQNAVFQQSAPDAAVAAVTVLDNAQAQAKLAIVHLHPRGYIVMSMDDALHPIVAFSEVASLTHGLAPSSPLAALLQAQNQRFAEILTQPQTRSETDYFARNRSQWERLCAAGQTRAAPLEPGPASTIIQPPLLSTSWGQNEPYDHYLPTSDKSIYDRAVAGCVPVAIAQIIKFHHWPPRGQGTKSYIDDEGEIRATLAANLALPFAWDVMQDAYAGAGVDPTAPANLAVARTCLALGVFFESDYEIDGTGTFSNDIPQVFADHLFFQSDGFKMSNIESYYGNYISQDALYANIRSDILAGRPAYVGFADQVLGGHSFVADGLLTDSGTDYYHFNYGWSGYDNGWYRLTDGYEDTVITNGINNIQPQFMPQFDEIAYEQSPNFTLNWQFPQYHAASVTAFRLQATRNRRTETLASNIPPDARSWNLANQPAGEVTYSLAAKWDGGAWQPAATVTVAVTPTPAELQMAVLTPLVTGFNTVPFTVDINVSDRPGLTLSAATSRPDIFPAANLKFSGQGPNRTLTLTPATTTRAGNVLVWITAKVGKAQITATADLIVNFQGTPLPGADVAVNCPGQEFFTDGHALWRVQNETVFSPPTALQGGGLRLNDEGELVPYLYDNEFSRLCTYVTGPCAIAFQWKVSSQPESEEYPDADYLIFAIDDMEIDRIAGKRNWKDFAIDILEPGMHTLSWTYLKGDGEWFMNDDSGWIDDFFYVPLYQVNVTGGNASSEYYEPAAAIFAAAGDVVTLTAKAGKRFRRWETEPDGILENAENAETTFIMPEEPVTATAIFEADVEITLAPGWNLIGLPVTLEAGDALPLEGLPAHTCQLIDGKQHYVKATTFTGGQAYWLFHDGLNALSLKLTGQSTTAELPTEPGWHLVAPTAATTIPDHANAWKWNGRSYEAVTGDITPPEACWLYIHP